MRLRGRSLDLREITLLLRDWLKLVSLRKTRQPSFDFCDGFHAPTWSISKAE
jgi:hypothetical protein